MRLTTVLRVVLALLLPLCALLPAQGSADPTPPQQPFLWRIEGATPSYLFGTIHLPDERVTTLHPAVTAALDGADEFYAELPMEAAMSGSAMRLMALPGRSTLADVVPEPLYARLESFLSARNLPIATFSRFKVWAIATQLPLLDHLAMIQSGTPLDMMLYSRARDDGLVVGGLETIEEQVGVFDGLSAAEQAQLLTDTLDQLDEAAETGEDLIEKTIALYVRGDADALMEMMHESSGANEVLNRKIEEALLWERNRRMAERIDAKCRAQPDASFFFAVGAAHFPGNGGVLALLRARGYRITRLPETAASVEAQIRALELELERLRARLAELRKAG